MLRFTTNASSTFVDDILPGAAHSRERGLTLLLVDDHDAHYLVAELRRSRMAVTPGWPRTHDAPRGFARASAHVRRS